MRHNERQLDSPPDLNVIEEIISMRKLRILALERMMESPDEVAMLLGAKGLDGQESSKEAILIELNAKLTKLRGFQESGGVHFEEIQSYLALLDRR